MQIKLYTIPIPGGESLMEDMNVFLRSKKILQVTDNVVSNDHGAHWCFCIKYLDDAVATKNQKIDYRFVLDDVSFQRFSRMREIRKALAKTEAIPAYNIFTDEELAGLSKIEDLTLASMRSVKGVGEKKVEKYGDKFIEHYVELELKCVLKPVQLNKAMQGLPFLGYLVKPYHIRLLGTSKRRFVRKFVLANENVHSGMWSQAEFQRHVLPLVAFTQHADTKNFRRKVIFDEIGLLP